MTAPDAKTDQDPAPAPLIARVFAGAEVPITVPLDGVDPDGDSVVIDGVQSPRSWARSPAARRPDSSTAPSTPPRARTSSPTRSRIRTGTRASARSTSPSSRAPTPPARRTPWTTPSR
ncbi:hypothetical protein [Pseudolysinimonas kribbensis]|uniref:hypothetical protein n=1 Tax=Pseudolysinimonas kribbensis TaxID=433641 RepID=UPI0024E1609E|nr:hypothetical protein [Pseudolysinimonas kribbensis]